MSWFFLVGHWRIELFGLRNLLGGMLPEVLAWYDTHPDVSDAVL